MKRLWVLPLAAILCGRPVDPPRLKEPFLPTKDFCLEGAKATYLLAYAYRQESEEKSRQLLSRANRLLSRCENSILRERIEELRSSFL